VKDFHFLGDDGKSYTFIFLFFYFFWVLEMHHGRLVVNFIPRKKLSCKRNNYYYYYYYLFNFFFFLNVQILGITGCKVATGQVFEIIDVVANATRPHGSQL
jgi:hypothetical protein